MYCNSCGKTIDEDVRFCSYCGTVVGIVPAPRKLMRSRADRKIAGVCAGLAPHLDLDVTVVRLLAIFITLATGICPGIVTYLLAWMIVPSEPELKPVLASQQPVAG
jgi:phage shock protein C